MVSNQGDLTEREQRLGEVVFACLQAVDNGQPLDRQDVVARHPEFASELEAFFADQDQFQWMAAPLRDIVEAAQPDETMVRGAATDPDAGGALPLGTKVGYFGDYELVEEMGRGGMG